MKPLADLSIVASPRDPPTMRLITRRPIDGDRVTVTGKLGAGGHGVRIVVEYRSDAYRVVSVTVDAPEDGEITSTLLGIAVKEAALEALTHAWSLFSATSDDMTVQDAETARGEYRADFLAKQRRRKLDDPFLKRVAEVYRAAVDAGATPVVKAIEDEFFVSTAQAERYVREARKRGFLPPGRRQKASD